MLNALAPITLTTGRHTLVGFSISGLSTYLQVPDLDVCFDMGECPLSAVPLNHVLLTHAHGDHSRCVLRHHALRDMLGMSKPASYYIPAAIADSFADLVRAEARFEGVPVEQVTLPHIVSMRGDRALVPVAGRRDLFVSAFEVKHRVPSLGYTMVERRHKLKPEFAHLSGPEIGQLKKRGEVVTDERDAPLLTFIGDCIGASLFEQDHIWQSPVVIIEATFLAPNDRQRARDLGHTHIEDVVEVLNALGPAITTEHIVLKHFSMKHKRDEIIAAVDAALPASFRPRVQLLL